MDGLALGRFALSDSRFQSSLCVRKVFGESSIPKIPPPLRVLDLFLELDVNRGEDSCSPCRRRCRESCCVGNDDLAMGDKKGISDDSVSETDRDDAAAPAGPCLVIAAGSFVRLESSRVLLLLRRRLDDDNDEFC